MDKQCINLWVVAFTALLSVVLSTPVTAAPADPLSGCSVTVARQLNSHGSMPFMPNDSSVVSCKDFERYGIMFFVDDGGSGGYTVAAYQENLQKGWRRVGSFDQDNEEVFQILDSGDVAVQGDWSDACGIGMAAASLSFESRAWSPIGRHAASNRTRYATAIGCRAARTAQYAMRERHCQPTANR